MKSITLAITLLCTCTMTGEARADISAAAVVANYITALGGRDRTDAVQTIIIRGTYTEGKARFNATTARMRPYYKLVGEPGKRSPAFEEGYDGSAWEYYGQAGIVLRTVGAPSAVMRHSTSILGGLADYAVSGASISLRGKTHIGERDAWQVRLTLRDGYQLDEFIDAHNWHLIAEREVSQIHAVGAVVPLERRFSDFRVVDGITQPFTQAEINRQTGEVLNRFVVNSIAINQPLTPDDFSPPPTIRTPRQWLIETLFAQRDDTGTVLWTLFDFRRAHPSVSTDEVCRIAGYQMVKVGAAGSAIALLEQNVADYPQSAAAASSLGRAYANTGQSQAARTALGRALELNPGDARTRAALASLGD